MAMIGFDLMFMVFPNVGELWVCRTMLKRQRACSGDPSSAARCMGKYLIKMESGVSATALSDFAQTGWV
jgi:hypothetical protein